jgi:hypothetical protein
MEVSCQLHAPAPLPRGMSPRYPLKRRLGGAQSRCGRTGENRTRAVQPVAILRRSGGTGWGPGPVAIVNTRVRLPGCQLWGFRYPSPRRPKYGFWHVRVMGAHGSRVSLCKKQFLLSSDTNIAGAHVAHRSLCDVYYDTEDVSAVSSYVILMNRALQWYY